MQIYNQIVQRFKLSKVWLFVFLLIAQHAHSQSDTQEAILQGAILVKPLPQPTQYQTDKIQPGHSVKISVLVENRGTETNPSGQIYVRFAFAKPLDNDPNSVLFETEKISLPKIEPNTSIELSFNKTHQWPSLPDFIRHDWGMREYQGILEIDNVEKTIGTLAITFSAYYYPGIRKEMPVNIAAKQHSEILQPMR